MRATGDRWRVRLGSASPWWPASLALCAAIVVSRRPDILLHASFWGEDGWNWYPDAYERGWRSLLVPWTGYLQTISRLVGIAAQPFPLSWAPTIFAAVAILIQAITATFLLSDRLSGAAPFRARLVFACVYLLLPNSFEVYANLTNAQWHLALLAFLVTISRPPVTRSGRAFEAAALTMSGLSGPFCLFVLPIALWRWWETRDRASLVRSALVAGCAAVQLWCLFGGGMHRAPPPLGASPRRLATIVSLQIVLPLVLGRHSTPAFTGLAIWKDGWLPIAAAALACLITLRAVWIGRTAVRLGVLFAGFVLAASLLFPVGGNAQAAWLLLTTPDFGDRYDMLPMLAWAAVLLTLAADRDFRLRALGRGLVVVMLVMLPGDWHLPTSFPFDTRTDFVSQAERFAVAPGGTTMSFPERPEGATPMVLRKR